jgi:hypothetical protein
MIARRSPRKRAAEHAGSADEPPRKLYNFVFTKKSYGTLDEYYRAVLDAQQSGTKAYWARVSVEKDEAKDCVWLKCSRCERSYSARNPSASVGGHFVTKEDGSWTCKHMQKAQARVDKNSSPDKRAGSHQHDPIHRHIVLVCMT